MLTGTEWAALGCAAVLLMVAGLWHLQGLRLIKRLSRIAPGGDNTAVLVAFWGLAALHVSEIVLGAGVLGVAIHWLDFGTINEGYGDSAAGLLYFSGITFSSLGYSGQTVEGPLRLMVMMQSLAGFMLITWSATYVYTIWGERFRQVAEKDDSGD